MSKADILWIDLEMTGLEPDTDRIVELAAIATNWDFEIIDSFEVIIAQPKQALDKMPEAVVKMHTKSGLLEKIPHGVEESEAEKMLMDFIKQHFSGKEGKVLLAGNSIHQDRRFIRKYWPKVDESLHYRMLDVSAWKVVFMNKYNLKPAKKSSHRAIDDIKESISELKTYLSYVKN